MSTTPELEAVYAEVRETLEVEEYDDGAHFDSPQGLHDAIRQMEIDGDRLVSLAYKLRSQLEEAEKDAQEDLAAALAHK